MKKIIPLLFATALFVCSSLFGQSFSSSFSDTQSQTGLYGQQIKENAYGAGINSDQYGRAHVYRTQDGTRLGVGEQDGVKRNGYGYGVHIDKFGRAVRDSEP